MGTRRKELFLLVLAVLMLGVAVWTFKPKPAPAPVATAAAPEAVKPSETPAKPGEKTGATQEGATQEGAQQGAAKEAAPRNPFTAPGTSVAPSNQGAAAPAAGQPEAGASMVPAGGATAAPPAAATSGGQQQSALTLTGVLSGKPTMAVLRQNDQRYFVKVGDMVGDGYRVQAISSQQVVLAGQQGKLILRMGGRQ